MIILLFDSLTFKYHLIPLTTVNKLLQISQIAENFQGADKDKYTFLVSEGCKNEKITECENWAFGLKSNGMSPMQRSLIKGTCISWCLIDENLHAYIKIHIYYKISL